MPNIGNDNLTLSPDQAPSYVTGGDTNTAEGNDSFFGSVWDLFKTLSDYSSPKASIERVTNIVKAIPKFGSDLMSAVNNALTGDRNYERQLALREMDNAFNKEQADLAWQRNLEASNTAVQRAAQDYAAAGFNPALAIGSSAGSVSYSPATASSSSPSTSSSFAVFKLLDLALSAVNLALVA